MKEFAMNIDEFSVGEFVVDKKDNTESKIADKTQNSICVFIKKKNDKHGVDAYQWLDMKRFNEQFKKKD